MGSASLGRTLPTPGRKAVVLRKNAQHMNYEFKFYSGTLTEDYSLGNRCAVTLRDLLQRGRGEASVYVIFGASQSHVQSQVLLLFGHKVMSDSDPRIEPASPEAVKFMSW